MCTGSLRAGRPLSVPQQRRGVGGVLPGSRMAMWVIAYSTKQQLRDVGWRCTCMLEAQTARPVEISRVDIYHPGFGSLARAVGVADVGRLIWVRGAHGAARGAGQREGQGRLPWCWAATWRPAAACASSAAANRRCRTITQHVLGPQRVARVMTRGEVARHVPEAAVSAAIAAGGAKAATAAKAAAVNQRRAGWACCGRRRLAWA